MDIRTVHLIDALSHPGGAILFQLVSKGALTEEELRQAVGDASQSTINRRLQRLGELGLLTREPGPRQYKDRPWAVSVAEAADAFLGGALELTRSIANQEGAERESAAAELREARKRRRALAAVKETDSGRSSPR